MQISMLSAQLGLGSELVDWYRDATSVPYGHLLIDLSPRTDDRLRYCTNSGSFPSKLKIPDRLKRAKIVNDEHTKCPYSNPAPIIFPQMWNFFASVLLKKMTCECKVNLHKGDLQSIKTYILTNFQNEFRLFSLKRILGSKEQTLWYPKKVQIH